MQTWSALGLLGSVCWTTVGISTGQANMIASNGVLALVNVIGIWRWLGRQSSYADGGKSAKQASRRGAAPTLFTATGIAGMPVEDSAGDRLGNAVEALIECRSGEVSYIVVATTRDVGMKENLRAVPRDRVHFRSDKLRIEMLPAQFHALPVLAEGNWPAEASGG